MTEEEVQTRLARCRSAIEMYEALIQEAEVSEESVAAYQKRLAFLQETVRFLERRRPAAGGEAA